MVKHPWPLLEISLSDFYRLATINMITYLPTYVSVELKLFQDSNALNVSGITVPQQFQNQPCFQRNGSGIIRKFSSYFQRVSSVFYS